LSSGTTYHFRAVASNSEGTVYGSDRTFYYNDNNNDDEQPVAYAGSDRTVNGGESFVLQGSGYDPDGGSVTYYWTCTGGSLSNHSIAQPTYTAFTISNDSTYTCTLTVTDNEGLTDSDSATIHVNASEDDNLTVQTNSATNIGANSVTLNGYLYGNNNSSNYSHVWFQYGTSTSYGYTTNQQTMSYSNSFSQNVNGLSQNTTYHYRAVANNSQGTVYGSDMTFYSGSSNTSTSFVVTKTVKNLSTGNLSASTYATANPSDLLLYTITIQPYGNQSLSNVYVRDLLPSNLIYKGSLVVTGSVSNNYGDVSTGINLGTISANQTVTLTYQAQVAGSAYFNYGTTTLTNTVTVTSSEASGNASAVVAVNKSGVAGVTTVSTGLTNNFLVDSFFLPLMIALAGIWMFRSGIVKFDKLVDGVKTKNRVYTSSKELSARIAQIKKEEKNI
jgi:uncharacterized repeat protein (TIGR01451 family)